MDLTEEEYDGICDAHDEEATWYFFLNYGYPIENPEYKAKYDAVDKALGEYCTYLREQQEKLKSERNFYL